MWNTTLYHINVDSRPYVGAKVDKLILRGVKWATVRASAGSVIDRTFERNYQSLVSGGIEVIPYHWYNPKLGYIEQVHTFLQAIGPAHLSAGAKLMIDLEDTKTIKAYKGIFADVGRWLAATDAQLIYLNPDFMRRYWNKEYWLDQYPLVIAHWEAPAPKVPIPWSPGCWYAWQYTTLEDGISFGLTTKEAALYVKGC